MANLEQAINFNEGKKEIPLELTPTMMHSNDLDILHKVQREVIPRELSSFGSQTAAGVVSTNTLDNKLTFYISDPRMYLDMLNSYFTADFKAIATTNGDVALPAFIDVGGIHACIKTLTIKIGGTVLMRLEDYNKWYNINNLATHSADYTDYMLAPSLDSQDDYESGRKSEFNRAVAFTVGNGVSLTAAGVVVLIGGVAGQIKVGDVLQFTATIGGNASTQYGTIFSITDQNNFVVRPWSAAFTAITGADANNRLNELRIVSSAHLSTRAKIVNQGLNVRAAVVAGNIATQKIQWRLPVGCLSFFKYFPLPYIQDIAPLEIEYEFIDSRLAICLRDAADAAADNKFGYSVTRPRMIAMLVEPSNKVREMHDMAFNANGIWFPYLNYRHFQNRLVANDVSVTFTFQTNISSARHALTVLTGQTNDDASATATQAVKSQSTFYRSLLTNFRYQSGSLQFPDYGPCQVDNYMAAEAWSQLLLAFNIKENTVHKSRIEPYEWQSTSSEKFIIGAPLAKDETMWTGISLKNNFLELTLNKGAVATAYNSHTFLGYDSALVISRSSGCKVFD